ncbi:hypothetical protein CVT26_015430 [Gymnopilus dilepis]|uniref:Uncharacterized protein n=1 Tax=Gymnopilus dilepis TaxID=231916 RepID=A0A409X731_9AGAR|nr:hypothetical protein CVT26_015430 [Gymnopilus dilepis]
MAFATTSPFAPLKVVAIVIQVMEFLYQFIDEIEYLWKTFTSAVDVLEGVQFSSRHSSNITKLLGSDTDDAWVFELEKADMCYQVLIEVYWGLRKGGPVNQATGVTDTR